jgi:hypothetical protein
MKRIAPFATLAAALLVRLPGIGWGLPPATPQVRASDFRSSYAFDEGDILSGAAKAARQCSGPAILDGPEERHRNRNDVSA